MKGRLYAVPVAAFLAAMQGGEAAARPGHRHWSHAAPRAVAPRVVIVPRVIVTRPVRVIPRVVYFAPVIPYAAPVYYAPAPSPYFPPTSYSVPSSYSFPAPYPSAPAPEAYSQPPTAYSEPPAPAPTAPAGPYAAEQAFKYRYFCPDVRLYYPEIKECPAGWLTVLPGKSKTPG